MKYVTLIWSFITIIGSIGGLLGYIILFPKISVSPSTILNPNNPFATPFILKNDGSFSIYQISTEVNTKEVVDARQNTLIKNTLISSVNDSEELRSNKETSLNISLESMIVGLELPFKKAHIEIIVKYKPFLLMWTLQESFQFIMRQSTSGESIWYPTSK